MTKMINNPTGIGHQEHIPTDKTRAIVEAYAMAGWGQDLIADRLRICKNTLYKHYREQLDDLKYDKLTSVSTNAYQMAMNGNEAMIKLILTSQARWCAYKPPEQDKSQQMVTLLESIVDKLS